MYIYIYVYMGITLIKKTIFPTSFGHDHSQGIC